MKRNDKIKMEWKFNELSGEIIKLQREINNLKMDRDDPIKFSQAQMDALIVYMGDEIDYRIEATQPLTRYDKDKTMACETEMQDSYCKFYDLICKP